MIPTDILNYRIVRHLGSGGMGSVYLAVNTNIDQQVAIKALRPEVASNAILRARFKQEAELLCSLDHPGIVKFLNYVETADGVYLIMEYVKGITLEDFINKKNGLIVEKKAYPLICEILDAFAYAHSKGIVHRDIKPSNIIIQDDGHIKIMDFGIAQIVSEASATDSRYIMGTPTYMSPEQIYGRDVDARSDIYSIGVLIHNMLTGRAPYDSTMLTAQEIKRRVVRDNMPRMAEYYPYISNAIQAVVDRATQKVPEARYQSCEEMKQAVKKALAPDPVPRKLMYAGIAVAAVLLLVGFFTWDYFRTKVHYYRDYVEVYGLPEGVGSLSGREMSHREASYRFEYSRYRLRRVSYVNSLGNLVDHHDSEDKDRIVDMTVTYTEGSGKIDAAKYMDRSGKVLYVKDYDSNFRTCTFKLDDDLGTEMTLNAQVALFQSNFDNTSDDGKGKISKYILDYDDNGYLRKVEYAGFGNVRVPDGQGIFGKSYVVDKKGRVIEEHYLGKDGNPKATKFGLGVKKFTYDDDDNLAKIEYLTVDGKPSSDGNNCPVVKLTYDKWGNRIMEQNTDVNGNPTVRKDNPFSAVVYEYNDDGFCVKLQFLGIDGKLTYIQGMSGYVNEYDANGYLSSRTFIDANGRAAYFTEDSGDFTYSKTVSVNDKHGNPIDTKLYNTSGQLSDESIYSHKVCTYDSVGNTTSEYYLDQNGKIFIPAKYGHAGLIVEYNQQGRASKVMYMDENKRPMALPTTHICSLTKDYDSRGNITKIHYFDEKNNPVLSDEGIATVSYEYDDNGNEIARSFYNTKGNPCVLNWFCARVEYGYDDQGNCISERYLNTDGKLMLAKGIAGTNYSFDKRGNCTKIYPIGTNGLLAAGRLEERRRFDDRDNIIESAYYNAAGKPALCDEGYHKLLAKYNSSNQCIQMEYYGVDGMLKNLKNQNYAVRKTEYDIRGNRLSDVFFKQDGTRGTDKSKVHKYYNQYDKVVNKISHQISFGIDGKPVAADGISPEGRISYDKRGNCVKLVCYDGYGKKINGKHNWCEQHFTYDDAGQQTSYSYFDINGKPVSDKDSKYHKVVFTYNSMRLVSSETYYGTDGRQMLNEFGYSKVTNKYNLQNQCTEKAYFGTNGKAVNSTYGWHREAYYFRAGNEYKLDLYDAMNRKIATMLKVNGKWELQNGGNAISPWRLIWQQYAQSCPVTLAGGLVMNKIVLGNNSITIHFRLTDFTADMIGEDVVYLLYEIGANLKRSTRTPSSVRLNIVIYDKYRNRV